MIAGRIKDNLKSSLAKHPFPSMPAECKTLSQFIGYKRHLPNHGIYRNIWSGTILSWPQRHLILPLKLFLLCIRHVCPFLSLTSFSITGITSEVASKWPNENVPRAKMSCTSYTSSRVWYQNNYEIMMVIHVKKASIMWSSVTKAANFPVLFFLQPRQQNNSLDTNENWVNYQFYNYIFHISFLNSVKTSAERWRRL